MVDAAHLRSGFESRYGAKPRIFRAPGRVNLIGEHTDYNDGFVFPCAIDFAAFVAASPRDDRKVRVATLNLDKEFEFSLDDPADKTFPPWTKYVQGVAMILEREGYRLKGANLLIDSDVPIGAGLSSSAALEVSIGLTMSGLSGHDIEKMKLARIGQAAEHEFAGVRSGIMDQFASTFGRFGHALFLDCRSMDWSAVPVADAKFVICNTKTKHDLADGEYNKRRADCEEAARLLGKSSLRDATAAELEVAELPPLLMKRARHVISENDRVIDAVDALKSDDLPAFGKLMNASHDSLRDDYEVSCRELDVMVAIARELPGVLGARMTGGGFGGCTVNLVERGSEEHFASKVFDEYKAATGITPEIYKCEASDGAAEVTGF